MQNDSPPTHLCGFLIVALFPKLHERKQYINLGTPTFIVNIIKYMRCSHLQYVFVVPWHQFVFFFSTRAGFGADGRGRKRSRLRALVPSTGRQLRSFSQKIVFNSPRQRGKNSLSPCHSPHLSTPTSATTFSLLTSNKRKEEALRQRRSSTLSPPYRDLG